MSTTGRLPGEDTSDEEETGENDDEDERWGRGKYRTGFEYSLDERLILSSLAHLRIGSILHSLNERFGKPNTRLPYFRMVLPPCGERRKKRSSATTWPYLQPLYIPEYNWLEPKMIQDAIYAQNLYMTLHRVPPPVPPQLRPVPYTHIEVPEYLKPRRYKSRRQKLRLSQPTSESQDTGTKTVMSNNSSRSRLTDETGTKKYRFSRSSGTVEDDTVSMSKFTENLKLIQNKLDSKSFSKKSNRRGSSGRCRRRRPSVIEKPRRKLLASWLKKIGETSKLCLDDGTRCSTPVTNHPTKSVLKQAHRRAKEECPCDCREKQVAEKGARDFGSPSEESDDTNKGLIDELDVMGFLPTVPDEPLVQFTNPQELPAVQKWIRMKNGLIYIHPVIASKLYKRSRALWNILEGGRCSMIHSPELCLKKSEERRLTWDQHAWFRRESARVVDEYYRTCFEMQIALAREFYPSMATDYLRNRDKFLQIYFVYLPARPQDCFRRPWKKSEYNREIYTRWKHRFQDTLEAKQKEIDRRFR